MDSAPPQIISSRFTGGFVSVVRTHMPGKMAKDYHYHWLLTPVFNFIIDFYLFTLKNAERLEKFRDEIVDLQVSN